jgi:hypothetical protein
MVFKNNLNVLDKNYRDKKKINKLVTDHEKEMKNNQSEAEKELRRWKGIE